MKKVTTLKIDLELWKRVKKHCIDKMMTVSEFVENALKEKLKEEREK
jgi:hypothetical protein